MYPIAYPTAYILSIFLGESHGITYKKAGLYVNPILFIWLKFNSFCLGLKSLMALHRSQNADDIDGLTKDEVHIICSVLGLREKLVVDVMTPIQDVFTLPVNAILDPELVHKVI